MQAIIQSMQSNHMARSALALFAFLAVPTVTDARRVFAGSAGVGTGAFTGLILAVLVLVIGISLTGTVVTEASAALTTASTDGNFPLVETILPFLPVIYVASIMGLSGAIGYTSFSRR